MEIEEEILFCIRLNGWILKLTISKNISQLIVKQAGEIAMPYWGAKADESDLAFDAVGSYVFHIKDRLFKSLNTVLSKDYPEQSVLVSIISLRCLYKHFPKSVKLHFGKLQFQQAKEGFYSWYEQAK